MLTQTYYSYDDSHGSSFLRRLGSWFGIKRLYCMKCNRTVKVHERMIGLGVDSRVLPDNQNSSIVAALRSHDWSVLDSVTRVSDWSLQPALFLALGRCELCDGPLVMQAEIHGKGSDGKIYFGVLFSTEISKSAGLTLLKLVLQKGLLSGGKAVEYAVSLCKTLDSGSVDNERPSSLG